MFVYKNFDWVLIEGLGNDHMTDKEKIYQLKL